METWQIPTLGITLRLKVGYQAVLESVIQGLKYEGFVVATEIDLQEKLKQKLNVDTKPFKVLRIYHPALHAQALAVNAEAAILPYSMTIAQMEDGDVELTFTDPLSTLTIEDNPDLFPIIAQAYEALRRVAESLPGK